MNGKLLVLGLGLLSLSLGAINAVAAQESFRIPRAPSYASPSQDNGEPPAAPDFRGTQGAIRGGVERTDMQGFADDGSTQRATTGRAPIAGGVQQNDMQAFADQAPLRPMNAAAQDNNLRGRADSAAPLVGGVSQLQLKALARHDVVLVIDKSGSMGTPDCPGVGSGSGLASLGLSGGGSSSLLRLLAGFGGISISGMSAGFGGMTRWEWCGAQTAALAQQYQSVAPNGLSVVLFSTFTKIFPNVKVQEIPRIFTEYRPGGITNEASAVRQTLGDYFNRKNYSNGNVKPLLVAVITDGEPTDKGALVAALAEAASQMRRPDEIKITFLQVGNSLDGSDFVERLERQFQFVSSKTFRELQQSGMTRALVDCISEHQPPRQ